MSWIPLESNPDVLNKYVESLGIKTSLRFQDVYGLDEELLGMLPPPVKALILLFPITNDYEAYIKTINDAQDLSKISEKVYFMVQTIGNACGTIGLFHALGIELLRFSELSVFIRNWLWSVCKVT
jgi:ubiquitin carboxyl-terminal hydrolase L3